MCVCVGEGRTTLRPWEEAIDRESIATAAFSGIVQLSTLIVGPNSLVQSALDATLNQTPPSYREQLVLDLETQAKCAFDIFQRCDGLSPIAPQGTMYLMVGIRIDRFRDIPDGITFAAMLMQEEHVQVLPGEIFQFPGYFRVVFTKPLILIEEAAKRIEEFCTRHKKAEKQ